MEIIDFHMHPFLEPMDNLSFYSGNMSLGYEDIPRELKTIGITKICGSVIKRAKQIVSFDILRKSNRDALKLRELYGGYYIPGFHVHPHFLEESLYEVEFMEENGVKLVGELVPYMYGWEDYSDKKFYEILELIGQYGMIVSLHTMNYSSIKKMVKNHPNIIFVLAHPGEYDTYMKHLELIEKCANVYLDLSGTGLFRYGMLQTGIKKIGAGRILFGTDYPISNPEMNIAGIRFEKIKDRDAELIFSENAKGLLKL